MLVRPSQKRWVYLQGFQLTPLAPWFLAFGSLKSAHYLKDLRVIMDKDLPRSSNANDTSMNAATWSYVHSFPAVIPCEFSVIGNFLIHKTISTISEREGQMFQ